MASPIEFAETNKMLLGIPEENVINLPVLHIPDRGIIVSCWELSQAELHELFSSPHIYLGVMGTSHPPVRIMTRSGMVALKEE